MGRHSAGGGLASRWGRLAVKGLVVAGGAIASRTFSVSFNLFKGWPDKRTGSLGVLCRYGTHRRMRRLLIALSARTEAAEFGGGSHYGRGRRCDH